MAAAPAWSPDPVFRPLGYPNGSVSIATQPACSEGGRLWWRLRSHLAAAICSAPHLFQPVRECWHQPSLPVLHGKRQLFTALCNSSSWSAILSSTNHHVGACWHSSSSLQSLNDMVMTQKQLHQSWRCDCSSILWRIPSRPDCDYLSVLGSYKNAFVK